MARLPHTISKRIRDRFEISNETLRRKIKENPLDDIEIEIGDSKQPDFKPQAKIKRWGNEVNFSLRAREHENSRVEFSDNVVKYITPEYEVHQYELDPSNLGEDGGLEFEWVLPQKPSTNILEATIQTKGLNFYYQAPLTDEEKARGAKRPENVVGSYAVYHATKSGNNQHKHYKTGKAFHIYRPKAIDASNNEAWCQLNIDKNAGILTVTVPQEFLDNAVYPIIVDPTFGYTSTGATAEAFLNDYGANELFSSAFFQIYSVGAGTLTSIHVYLSANYTDSLNFKGLYYEVNGNGANSHSLIGVSSETGVSVSTTPGWETLTMGGETLVTSSAVGIAGSQVGLDDGKEVYNYYDSGDLGDEYLYKSYGSTNTESYVDGLFYTSPHDPMSETIRDSLIFSIYATYTEAGDPPTGDIQLRNPGSGGDIDFVSAAPPAPPSTYFLSPLSPAGYMQLIPIQTVTSTNYTLDLTDTVSTVESSLMATSKILLETITTIEIKTHALTKTLLETAANIESIVKSGGKTLLDSTTLAEVYSASLIFLKEVTDSITLSETFTKVAALFRNLTDSITLNETLSKSLSSSLSLTDSVTPTETVSKSISKTQEDHAIITEMFDKVFGAFKSVTDTVSAAEDFLLEYMKNLALVESVTISDTIATVLDKFGEIFYWIKSNFSPSKPDKMGDGDSITQLHTEQSPSLSSEDDKPVNNIMNEDRPTL